MADPKHCYMSSQWCLSWGGSVSKYVHPVIWEQVLCLMLSLCRDTTEVGSFSGFKAALQWSDAISWTYHTVLSAPIFTFTHLAIIFTDLMIII